MSLTEADVKRIAHLARIEIEDKEVAPVLGQLSNILGLVEQMQAINTDGIAPMAHAQDVSLRLREDRVTESDQHELFQSVAPQVEAGLYLVPKVME
ncbi:MAG: Asp-tRNA(Asn)/Glu-tRNA(Gln) amidotransferase subunit GatC [Burkholderiales bacterium]|nr:Asp-tRNA(Asn)/Glu-tRNA(Gln) amidotransferase subunit GatC [Burkholderiales bacterium]